MRNQYRLFLCGMVLLGLMLPVYAALLSTTGNPPPILLWSAPTGSTEIMSDNAAKVSCSGDGKYVAAGYGAGIIELRDRQGAVLWRWQSPHSYYTVWQVAVSRNGEYTGIVLYDPLQNNMGELDYFNRAGKLLWSRPLKSPFGSVSLSGNGNTIALADLDRIRFIDASGNLIGTTTLEGFPWSIAIADDGSTAVAGTSTKNAENLYVMSANGTIRWNSPARLRLLDVAISGDGTFLASAAPNELRYFSIGGDRLWSFNSTPGFTEVVVSSDGTSVAASSVSQLRYFNSSGSELWQYEVSSFPTKPGPYLSQLAMSEDGKFLTVSTVGNRTLFFNHEGELLWQNASPHWIVSTSMSRDGKFIAIGTEQEFMYFDTGVNVPVEPKPTVFVTTTTQAPTPSATSTPRAPVPVFIVIAGICLALSLWQINQKK
jgi:hypothetical protein